MKLYCYTLVDTSAPWYDGTESKTFIYKEKKKCIDDAYDMYCECFETECEDGEDENGETLLPREKFLAEDNMELIQLPDFHIQIEYFEAEI